LNIPFTVWMLTLRSLIITSVNEIKVAIIKLYSTSVANVFKLTLPIKILEPARAAVAKVYVVKYPPQVNQKVYFQFGERRRRESENVQENGD